MDRRQFNQLLAAGAAVLPSLPLALAGRRRRVEAEPAGPVALPPAPGEVALEHWRAARNSSWRWFEKSELIGGEWILIARTLPIHRVTGGVNTDDAFDRSGCVDLLEVPEPLRLAQENEGDRGAMTDFCVARRHTAPGPAPVAARKARDGRPPSRWLLDLETDQLRWWLASFEPPEAGVSGMTYLDHLVNGHSFDPARVEGLTLAEQAKLHGAAHGGY